MKNLIFAFIGLLAISSATAQKTMNDPNAQVRNVSSFHAIKVATGIHLYLTQGGEEKVAVGADNTEDRDKIKTEVVDGVLKIYYENNHDWFNNNNHNRNLRAYVSCKTLDALKGSSGAHVEVDGSINSGKLAMDFSSGAWFKGSVAVTSLTVDQSSGSHSVISGTASDLKVDASSGSHIDAADLQSSDCDADASSGAHIDVKVSKALTANASSGGHISYSGDASVRTINTSSGGNVSKR
jgi:phage baseplate assembly protein gpV